jgi:hypothetical protein
MTFLRILGRGSRSHRQPSQDNPFRLANVALLGYWKLKRRLGIYSEGNTKHPINKLYFQINLNFLSCYLDIIPQVAIIFIYNGWW